MQAVQFFAVCFFASGIVAFRGGLFCRGVGVLSGQDVIAGVFCGGGLRKCKPFVFLRCFFLQAVLVPCVAVFFVVGEGGFQALWSWLGFFVGAVCVSASRAVFCGVFFCKKYCGLSFGKKKFFCGGRGSLYVLLCVCFVGGIMQ